ncbi:MAG TPA: HIT family protein [Chloroflexota bacterium]|jgi:histidine triad (HIT) family protein
MARRIQLALAGSVFLILAVAVLPRSGLGSSSRACGAARGGDYYYDHRVARCVFCDIVAGTLEACVVYQDDASMAFLDRAPLMPGHVLVVPKAHIETLGDLLSDQVGPYFTIVQRLARAVEQAMHADGSFVALNIRISQSVPHLHVHVVPRRKNDGLFGKTFQWIRHPYASESAMRETQRAIQAAL